MRVKFGDYNLMFTIDDRGRKVFSPYGFLGSSYVLDEVAERKLKSFLKMAMLWPSCYLL